MSKTQRRNNSVSVSPITSRLLAGHDLTGDEQVQCDLQPTQPPEPHFGAHVPSTREAVDRLVTGQPIQETRGPGRPPVNRIDLAKLAFDRKMADALRHDSDSEGGHVD